ncbi:MAG: pyridoxal phosphate-dependent aminotransferase [Spirochaetaceae bacterium]|jgi:aspartate aminotransferase|nr:pyridoxal phosphate-dependent aminotransferase [Spirochaetaceae bacterium]
MAIANNIKDALASSSMIRKMFEEGAALKKQYGTDKVFDFSLGNPDIEPPPAFHRVFLKMAQEDKKGSHGYMPNAGFYAVRETLARKAGAEQAVRLEASHIVMTCGAAGALNVALKAILNPGDEVIVARPYFMEYKVYAANHGGILVEVDTKDNFDLDVPALAARLSEKTAAVLINSPHNPTGKIYDAATLAELSGALRLHGTKTGRFPYLIADEPYREIVYQNKTVPPVLCAYDESLVISSYSKSLSLPGERIGYIAVSPTASRQEELVNALIYTTRTLGFVNAPALMQRIVAELTFAKVDCAIYARRLALLKQILTEAGIRYSEPEGAFYLFAQVPEGLNDQAFAELLKQHLILAVPGTGFGKPGWIRFAYCIDESLIAASATAFKQVMAALKN